MSDFKNKYFIDFVFIAAVIFIGVLNTKEYSEEASILMSLSILLSCTFAITTSNLINSFTKREEIISKGKQRIYIIMSAIIIIGILIFDMNNLGLVLVFPVCLSISAIVNTLVFKEKK